MLKRIGIVIILFGVVNLLLLEGQSLYHRGDSQRLKQMENWLDERQTQLKNKEKELKSLNSQIEKLDTLLINYKQKIDRGGTHLIDSYNAKVDEYNDLLDKYNSKLKDYKMGVYEYNSKVREVNKLSEETGTRWYIIPVPLPLGIGRGIK